MELMAKRNRTRAEVIEAYNRAAKAAELLRVHGFTLRIAGQHDDVFWLSLDYHGQAIVEETMTYFHTDGADDMTIPVEIELGGGAEYHTEETDEVVPFVDWELYTMEKEKEKSMPRKDPYVMMSVKDLEELVQDANDILQDLELTGNYRSEYAFGMVYDLRDKILSYLKPQPGDKQ